VSTAHAVLAELLEPLGGCLTVEVAERLVGLSAAYDPEILDWCVQIPTTPANRVFSSPPGLGDCKRFVGSFR
jgi:hypothetical protein